jgi:RHS repeat-associated protein
MHVRFYQIVNRIVRRAVMIRFRAGVVLASVLVAQGLASGQTTETVRYYHTDAIGSVRAITDEAGQLVARYDFLPFGEEYPATPGPHVPLQFAGKERDYATGFDYFGGRCYSSGTGRFTTVDPVVPVSTALQNPQLWNRYAYALNNPVRFIDPDGRCLWDLCVTESTAAYLVGATALATSVWLMSPAGQQAVSDVVDDARVVVTTAASAIQSWFQSDGADTPTTKPGTYRPDRTLPQDPKSGRPIGETNPDGTPAGEHTQIGKKTSSDPRVGDYTKSV